MERNFRIFPENPKIPRDFRKSRLGVGVGVGVGAGIGIREESSLGVGVGVGAGAGIDSGEEFPFGHENPEFSGLCRDF